MRILASRRWSRREARRREAPPAALLLDAEDILLQPDDQGNTEARFVTITSESCKSTKCAPCGARSNGEAVWAVDFPLSIETNEGKFYYLRDSIGTIVGLVDEYENLVNEYVYDAFGNIVYISEYVQQPYKFTAREYDDETGQYYYRARTYLPETGRFAQQDPLGMVDGTNMYRCFINNPINNIDPTGFYNLVNFPTSKYNSFVSALDETKKLIQTNCQKIKSYDFCMNKMYKDIDTAKFEWTGRMHPYSNPGSFDPGNKYYVYHPDKVTIMCGLLAGVAGLLACGWETKYKDYHIHIWENAGNAMTFIDIIIHELIHYSDWKYDFEMDIKDEDSNSNHKDVYDVAYMIKTGYTHNDG